MMKSADRVKKMRDASVDELVHQEAQIKEELFRLRFQWAMGQTETLKKMREIRKDRARLLTVIKEKQTAKD
jgi:large subunit ribosomal protein L29